MLAKLTQPLRVLSTRADPAFKQRVLTKSFCYGIGGRFQLPALHRPQSVARAFGVAVSHEVANDLKAQIISESGEISFRYEVDNYKSQSEEALNKAEKAVG